MIQIQNLMLFSELWNRWNLERCLDCSWAILPLCFSSKGASDFLGGFLDESILVDLDTVSRVALPASWYSNVWCGVYHNTFYISETRGIACSNVSNVNSSCKVHAFVQLLSNLYVDVPGMLYTQAMDENPHYISCSFVPWQLNTKFVVWVSSPW